MARYWEPLLNAVAGSLGTAPEYVAALAAVAAHDEYSDLTLPPPEKVITHFATRVAVYPHQQVYPLQADLGGELYVEGLYTTAIDTWVRATTGDKAERSGRAYTAAAVDLLRDNHFGGMVTIVGRIQMRLANTNHADSGRIDGTQLIITYQMDEVPT